MTGIIILAAGSSGRFGTAKQNLVFEGRTLLQRAIEGAMNTEAKHIVVVLGANSELILPTISKLPVHIVQNAVWQEGMSSSIRLGINTLKETYPSVTSAILMLCDQPFVNADVINQLIQKKDGKGIIASGYNNTAGVPVLFDAKYFDELLSLKGQEGAKKVLMKHPDDVAVIPFPLGNVDIDTAEDFANIKIRKTP